MVQMRTLLRAASLGVVVAAAIGLARPIPALAQPAESVAGRLGFGVQAGIFDESGPAEPRPLFGALLRFRLTPSFALEASGAVSWRHTFAPVAGDVTVRTVPLFANVLFYLLPGTPDRPAPFSPYLAGGGGVIMTRVEPDSGGSDTSFDVGGNVGGGIDLPLGGRTVFGVDARYLFSDRDSDLSGPGGTTRIDVARRGYTVTGQLTFYF